MSLENTNLDSINEVYRNAHVALQSISDVSPEITDTELKKEVLEEYDGYEKLIGEISAYMTEKGYEKKELGKMKKAMMWSAIKMNTAMDDSKNHIAEIMIKGTTMGITELCTLINNDDGTIDKDIIIFAERLKNLEESYIERLKKFL